MNISQFIEKIHIDCHMLCKNAIGRYLPVAGNVGVFCHSENEYKELNTVREQITKPSTNAAQKYFELKEPIIISAHNGLPESTYTHLYIRQPDPSLYGKYSGDIDFIVEPKEYIELKNSVIRIPGAEIYDRPGWDTIQLTDPSINSVAYVCTKEFAEKVRLRFD